MICSVVRRSLTHGLRQGEALGLKWSEVDLAEKTLQWVDGKPEFVETKTKQSNRVIALSDRVVKALKAHRKAQLEARMKAGDQLIDHGWYSPRDRVPRWTA